MRRMAVVVSAAALLALVAAPQALAAPYVCPAGWTSVTNNPIGGAGSSVTKFCKKATPGGPTGTGTLYFIRVYSNAVSNQYDRVGDATGTHPWGSATNPNPVYNKHTPGSWLNRLTSGPAQIVLNGTFFDDTGLKTTTSTISFPTYQLEMQVNTGKHPSLETYRNFRRCLGWGTQFSFSQLFNWVYANNDWSGTNSYASTSCMSGGAQQAVVGFEQSLNFQNGASDARTYIGTAGPDNGELCFLVGGYAPSASMPAVMNGVGCTARLQLDGGHSTGLSYRDPNTGARVDAINGYGLLPTRPVPHVIAIY